MADTPSMAELLGANPPQNWGKWGDDDQVGSLNYLDAAQVLRGVASVKTGQVFTLQCPMGHPHGDPVFPGREGIKREMVWDQELFESGNGPSFPGGIRASDDKAEIFLQGSSQYDALGHAWYDDTLWNGRSADTTNGGGMSWASVLPIAERGIVGRGRADRHGAPPRTRSGSTRARRSPTPTSRRRRRSRGRRSRTATSS